MVSLGGGFMASQGEDDAGSKRGDWSREEEVALARCFVEQSKDIQAARDAKTLAAKQKGAFQTSVMKTQDLFARLVKKGPKESYGG